MTDNNITWSTTRTDITQAFGGDPPGPLLEEPIIHAFEQNPHTVIRIADEVATAYKNGDIQSPWPILRSRLERANEPLRNVTVRKPDQRAKAIARAEQWIRTSGIHFDSQTELEDELFNSRGILHTWAKDQPLRTRMLDLWQTTRPNGVRVERKAYVRAETWKRTRARIQKTRHPATVPEDAGPPDDDIPY